MYKPPKKTAAMILADAAEYIKRSRPSVKVGPVDPDNYAVNGAYELILSLHKALTSFNKPMTSMGQRIVLGENKILKLDNPVFPNTIYKPTATKQIKTRIAHGRSPVGYYRELLRDRLCPVCTIYEADSLEGQKPRNRPLCSNHVNKPPSYYKCGQCKRKYRNENVICCGEKVKPYWWKPDHMKPQTEPKPGWRLLLNRAEEPVTDDEGNPLYAPPMLPKWLYAQLISAGDSERAIDLYRQSLELLGLTYDWG